jgi:hypothetical protein
VTDRDTVLLWGLPSDPPLAAVRNALQRTGQRVLLLDQRAVLEISVELAVGSSIEAHLCLKNETIDLAAVKAAYLRPCDPRDLPGIARAGPKSETWQLAVDQHDILLLWADLTPALALNRPAAMATNDSKPYQARIIESHGFHIPDTLITTDPLAALEFWKQHGEVIYKAVSATRNIVSHLTAGHIERLKDITSCPTQFQQYIAGTDYRVHVVGKRVFACRIIAQAADYRYQREGVDIQPCSLPDEVADRCRILARSLNLSLSGTDLRLTPEGKWYCFEVNPSPVFTFFEEATGQPIAEAVACLLASGGEDEPQPPSVWNHTDLV